MPISTSGRMTCVAVPTLARSDPSIPGGYFDRHEIPPRRDVAKLLHDQPRNLDLSSSTSEGLDRGASPKGQQTVAGERLHMPDQLRMER